jgi:hypothetical protein
MIVPTSHNTCTKFGLKIPAKSQLVFYQRVSDMQLPKKNCCKIVQITIFSSAIAPRGAGASSFALSA